MSHTSVGFLRSHSVLATFTFVLLITDSCWSAAIGSSNNELLEESEWPMKEKRLSRHALIKLILQRNGRSPFAEMKFAEQDTPRLQRRSVSLFPVLDRRGFDAADADFQNCFLSPVQCMLPRMHRRQAF